MSSYTSTDATNGRFASEKIRDRFFYSGYLSHVVAEHFLISFKLTLFCPTIWFLGLYFSRASGNITQ